MADVKMPESIPCKFDARSWRPCKRPSDNGLCSLHEGKKCCSCGEQAMRSCDEGMGGLTCGALLCDTCHHGDEGGHVTQDVYRVEMEEKLELIRTGKESKRMLAARGIPTDVELPRHLKELLDSGSEDFSLTLCYILRLKQGSMYEFPAILRDGRTQMVVTTADKESIIRVWRSLESRSSEMVIEPWMVNEKIGVGYGYFKDEMYQRQSKPARILSAKEIDDLFAKDDHPFRWAPGIIGVASLSQRQFEALIETAAAA